MAIDKLLQTQKQKQNEELYADIDRSIINGLVRLTTGASNIAMKYFSDPDSLATKFKADQTFVTVADGIVEDYIKVEINKLVFDPPFLGEESATTNIEESKTLFEQDYLWSVDPIDGTTNFAHQIPLFAISIGLMKKHQTESGECQVPVLGVIALPALNKFYFNNTDKLYEATIVPGKLTPHIKPVKPAEGIAPFLYVDNHFFKHYKVENTDELKLKPRIFGAGAIHVLYSALGKGASFIPKNRFHIWDVAGGLAMAYAAGQRAIELNTGNIIEAFTVDDFVIGKPGSNENWAIKDDLIITRPENFDKYRRAIKSL
ncbi:hypothetical protein HOK51_01820 [Candidatus Woesearchaeota archaeon]|jgi:myo-inositol-1(or 4)-monophosphatase|nr:hypothetical protein [Candidatus Woesearchaeota archaeon]MBT6518553.1 hypothetical protein [Candidatus Woesearchaeota archaeon]MBT7368425.1 hypothetical protein [Candidatus Woesearchaeota archaeon]